MADASCPVTESRRARVARVAGLQRTGACVVASPLRPDEAENLLLREMQDSGGHDHYRGAILKGIQQQCWFSETCIFSFEKTQKASKESQPLQLCPFRLKE